MSREYLELEKSAAKREELETLTLGALRKAVFDGDIKHGSVMMGQIAGLIHEIKPMKDILDSMVKDAQQEFQKLSETMRELSC
jgi:enoyl-[acyl-carrier protein] reductase II